MQNLNKSNINQANFTLQYNNHIRSSVVLHSKRSKSNGECSSELIVQFIMRVFRIDSSNLTGAIEKTLINLDLLARRIDKVIDLDPLSYSASPTISSFKSLEQDIIACFKPMFGAKDLNSLIEETFSAVQSSFEYNTSGRSTIYSLRDTNSNRCTTFYLLPIIQYLCHLSTKTPQNINQLFLVFATYIQMLDDFMDVIDDFNSGILTPVTNELNELVRGDRIEPISSVNLKALKYSVESGLDLHYNAFLSELRCINNQLDDKGMLASLGSFQEFFALQSVPHTSSITELVDFLGIIKKNIPPLICYAP